MFSMVMLSRLNRTLLLIAAAALLVAGFWASYELTNPGNYASMGEIPTPAGYHRVESGNNAYAEYLRSLPLKKRGSKIKLYTGGNSRLQFLAYAVVDLPLLSNAEQCADACMRFRAESLYSRGRYSEISFKDVNGKTLTYKGGSSRKEFEKYLRNLYGVASTYSLKHEMKTRKLSDIQPGDVFVYAAGDHDLERKVKSKYGHAIMVVDVAVDRKGNKMFMLAEGNTPARDIHVMRNLRNPFRSPWFRLDEDSDVIFLTPFYFKAEELRYW